MVFADLENVSKAFGHEGSFKSLEEIRAGHINCTYKLTFTRQSGEEIAYIVQKINTVAFRDPDGLMNNIGLVTEHLANKFDRNDPEYNRRFLHFLKTEEGSYIYRDGNGGCWRSYIYVDNATAHNFISDPRLFYESGKGFGAFQKQLSDFPAEQLIETIPNFHNTKKRFVDFVAAVAEDKAGRAKEVEQEIDFFFERRKMMGEIIDKMNAGILPMRVTHNDTKLNNVLIDDTTKEAICVIDLDTVMPGSALYDYGDSIRFGACTATEDESDLSKVDVDLELFKLYTKGYLEESGDALTKDEIHYFPLGAKIMTCEVAMRFLTDYLNGDVYFKIRYPEHNLVRARVQMKLLTAIEAKYDEMTAYVDSLI